MNEPSHRLKTSAIGALALVLFSGCAPLGQRGNAAVAGDGATTAWEPWDSPQNHLVIVGSGGQPLRPEGRRRRVQGKWEYSVKARPFAGSVAEQSAEHDRYLRSFVEHLCASGKHKLLIYAHGGMNWVAGAVQNAGQTLGRFEERPAAKDYRIDADTYPIFICWNSPFTGYGEQLAWVRAGKTEEHSSGFGRHGDVFALLTAPLHLVADVGRAATRFPAELAQFAYNDTHTAAPRRFTEYSLMERENSDLLKAGPSHKDIRVDPVKTLPATPGRHVSDISNVVLFPVRNATIPVIDAIGVRAWDNMLRHTETMFDRTKTQWSPGAARSRRGSLASVSARAAPAPRSAVEASSSDDHSGALALFMTYLSEAGVREVTLVGHSMGAIIANRLLVDYPGFNYRHIVYMAAACSVRDFEGAVVPYLRRNPRSEFFNLSLHPQCESGEIAVAPSAFPLDLAPRGSLLVWIDNIFGHPPSEKQRRFGVYQTAIIANRSIPQEVRSRITFKCFPRAADARGLVRLPQHHGDFSRSPYWDPSFWAVQGDGARVPP